jgi:hypothetical protein
MELVQATAEMELETPPGQYGPTGN